MADLLPAINASLNGVSAVLLVLGLVWIKQGKRQAHERAMLGAFGVSAAFLACYLYYHFVVIPEVGTTKFVHDSDVLRGAYLVLLATHVLGAMVNLPMILWTLWLAHKERWDAHRRWAKWTWPLWFYVSVTGVLVYLALYQLQEPVRSTAGL